MVACTAPQTQKPTEGGKLSLTFKIERKLLWLYSDQAVDIDTIFKGFHRGGKKTY